MRGKATKNNPSGEYHLLHGANEVMHYENNISYKKDWRDFKDILLKNKITKLYHFTDNDNIDSIKNNGGLWSMHYCKCNDVKIPRPGGNELSWDLDTRMGLSNYVHLSFVKDHPMMFVAQNDGRIQNPVLMEISTDVIFFEKTIFTERNAVKKGSIAHKTLDKFNLLPFHLFHKKYFDLTEEERQFYQAEVLAFEKIPLDYIINIYPYPKNEAVILNTL